MSSSTHPTARARVLTDVIPGALARDAALSLGFAGLIALAAQLYLYLPGNPVPITAQTFVVLAGGIALGARRAAVGSGLYLALGAVGLPWFAASNGATFGYIVGFALAATLLGAVAQRGRLRGPLGVTLAMVVGNLVIYAAGVAWVYAAFAANPAFLSAFGLTGPVPFGTVLAYFVTPFLLGDAIKLALAVAVVPTVWRLVGRDR
ncbi:biotin transporter BioY [Nitriliruptoraceae bacterium ZYF776]|nr:biotin transporter BioY [Profundirhabdus halotolerans]